MITRIDEAVQVGALVTTVLSRLNNVRRAAIQFRNETPYEFLLDRSYHWHGRFEVPPDSPIQPGDVTVFGSENKDNSILTGTCGCCLFQSKAADVDIAILWTNPYMGSYKAGATLGGHGETSRKSWDEIYDLCTSGYTEHSRSTDFRDFKIAYSAGELMMFSIQLAAKRAWLGPPTAP